MGILSSVNSICRGKREMFPPQIFHYQFFFFLLKKGVLPPFVVFQYKVDKL